MLCPLRLREAASAKQGPPLCLRAKVGAMMNDAPLVVILKLKAGGNQGETQGIFANHLVGPQLLNIRIYEDIQETYTTAVCSHVILHRYREI